MQGKISQFNTTIESFEQSGRLCLRPRYSFVTAENAQVPLSPGIGLQLSLADERRCQHCQAAIQKSFGSGFCYTCFSTLARCDLCVVSPDRCHYHQGTCREPEWGESFCMQPHTVYLAATSGAKVGITRRGREWHRWVDQGASRALAIVHTTTRRAAGCVEAHLKNWLSDRTDWRRLVTGRDVDIDLTALQIQVQAQAGALSAIAGEALTLVERDGLHWCNDTAVDIHYPVDQYTRPDVIRLGADLPELKTNLLGIRGGYLLVSQGAVPIADLVQGGAHIRTLPALPASDVEHGPQISLF